MCVLTILCRGDRYGYELVNLISSCMHITEGTIYPLLKRLTNEHYFETYLKESTEGPPRKYYHLTAAGREYTQTLRNEWDEFYARVDKFVKENS